MSLWHLGFGIKCGRLNKNWLCLEKFLCSCKRAENSTSDTPSVLSEIRNVDRTTAMMIVNTVYYRNLHVHHNMAHLNYASKSRNQTCPSLISRRNYCTSKTTSQEGEGHQVRSQEGQGHQVRSQEGEGHQVTAQEGEGHQVTAQEGEGHQVRSQEGEGHQVTAQEGEGHEVRSQEGEGHQVTAQEGQGHQVTAQEGQGHQVRSQEGQGHQVRSQEGEGHQVRSQEGEGQQITAQIGQGQQTVNTNEWKKYQKPNTQFSLEKNFMQNSASTEGVQHGFNKATKGEFVVEMSVPTKYQNLIQKSAMERRIKDISDSVRFVVDPASSRVTFSSDSPADIHKLLNDIFVHLEKLASSPGTHGEPLSSGTTLRDLMPMSNDPGSTYGIEIPVPLVLGIVKFKMGRRVYKWLRSHKKHFANVRPCFKNKFFLIKLEGNSRQEVDSAVKSILTSWREQLKEFGKYSFSFSSKALKPSLKSAIKDDTQFKRPSDSCLILDKKAKKYMFLSRDSDSLEKFFSDNRQKMQLPILPSQHSELCDIPSSSSGKTRKRGKFVSKQSFKLDGTKTVAFSVEQAPVGRLLTQHSLSDNKQNYLSDLLKVSIDENLATEEKKFIKKTKKWKPFAKKPWKKLQEDSNRRWSPSDGNKFDLVKAFKNSLKTSQGFPPLDQNTEPEPNPSDSRDIIKYHSQKHKPDK